MDTAAKELTKQEKLIHFVTDLEENRANSLYDFLQDEIEESNKDFLWTDELKADLDQMDEDLDNGRLQGFMKQSKFTDFIKNRASFTVNSVPNINIKDFKF